MYVIQKNYAKQNFFAPPPLKLVPTALQLGHLIYGVISRPPHVGWLVGWLCFTSHRQRGHEVSSQSLSSHFITLLSLMMNKQPSMYIMIY